MRAVTFGRLWVLVWPSWAESGSLVWREARAPSFPRRAGKPPLTTVPPVRAGGKLRRPVLASAALVPGRSDRGSALGASVLSVRCGGSDGRCSPRPGGPRLGLAAAQCRRGSGFITTHSSVIVI